VLKRGLEARLGFIIIEIVVVVFLHSLGAPMSDIVEPSDTIPKIPQSDMPESEKPAAGTLAMALVGMHEHAKDFASDLELFENLLTALTPFSNAGKEIRRQAREWSMVAARDGSMNIYHFGKSIVSAEKSLALCESLVERVDKSRLGKANKLFRQSFPQHERIRHTVGHMAEFMTDPTKSKKHEIKGGWSDATSTVGPHTSFVTSLAGRNFITTYEGNLVSYKISKETLDRLIEVKREFYSGFRNLEDK
jgi:hypothetical protein